MGEFRDSSSNLSEDGVLTENQIRDFVLLTVSSSSCKKKVRPVERLFHVVSESKSEFTAFTSDWFLRRADMLQAPRCMRQSNL
eukprot:c245_g1_i1 orf=162-410(-)